MTPLISLAVPVYNGAATLGACLESIEAAVRVLPEAAREQIEVIVCDNHSTDGSAAIIAAHAFSCPSRVVRPPEHLENRTENWNFALDAATGTWMVMLHADDGLTPQAFSSWMQAIASPAAQQADLISARHHTFSTDMDRPDPVKPRFARRGLIPGRLLARWSLPLLCSFVPFTLMRRTAYAAAGGLDPRFQLTQDWELWWRMCLRGDVLYWPVAVGLWRLHGSGPNYQRLNMSDYIATFAEMRAEGLPTPVRVLGERNIAARVGIVLADDDTPEAAAIRAEVRALSPRSAHFWTTAGALESSAALNVLRLVGAARYRPRPGPNGSARRPVSLTPDGLGRSARLLGRMTVSGDHIDRLAVGYRLGQIPGVGAPFRGYVRLAARTPGERYTAMQRAAYEGAATADGDTIAPGRLHTDYVVGSWREHDEWPDYEDFLMRYVTAEPTQVALDFGCGPGRNIRRWSERFVRIDGADIAQANLDNARIFLDREVPDAKRPNLYLTRGADCGDAPDNAYDFVFSTIALQHICVHSIRLAIFRDIFRCLKPGGRLSVQMGYGVPSPDTVGYDVDFTDAHSTNRGCDVAISSPDEPRGDLEAVGFTEFESWIRPVGPGDSHPQWIFFTAVKPLVGARPAP